MKMFKLLTLAMVLITISNVEAGESDHITAFNTQDLSASVGNVWLVNSRTDLGRSCLEPVKEQTVITQDTFLDNQFNFTKDELLAHYGADTAEDLQDSNLRNNMVNLYENTDTKLSFFLIHRKGYKIATGEFNPTCKVVRATDAIRGGGLSWSGECGTDYVRTATVGKNLTVLYVLDFKEKKLKLKFEDILNKFGNDLGKTTFGKIMEEASKVSFFRKKKAIKIEQKIHILGGNQIPNRTVDLLTCYQKGLDACQDVIKQTAQDAEKYLSDNNPNQEELKSLYIPGVRRKFNYVVLSVSTAPYANSNWEAGKFDRDRRLQCGLQ